MSGDQAIEEMPDGGQVLFTRSDREPFFLQLVQVLTDILGRDPHEFQFPLLRPCQKSL